MPEHRRESLGQELLSVKHITIDYVPRPKTRFRAVEDISFSLHEGEKLGIVGESGCGKTTLILSLLQLLPIAGQITSGEIVYRGTDLLSLDEKGINSVRWKEIAFIFQGAMNALNPVKTIGDQIAESIRCHSDHGSKDVIQKRVDDLLEMVGISSNRGRQYPFQFSGGMRQRAMIAMALACSPSILIADEPTTALDVMIQAQILELLEKLSDQLGQSLILVTHDLGVVAEVCDHVLVMYGGITAEYGDVDTIYNHPVHPYTKDLIRAFPNLADPHSKLVSIPGYPPRLDQLPKGCRFAPRCSFAFDRCQMEKPPLYQVGIHHQASCFLVEGKS
jgi:peptide/nickel transport system ATP-binding protein